MSLTIHNNIIDKLDYFITNNKIPHIIFYGPSHFKDVNSKVLILSGDVPLITTRSLQNMLKSTNNACVMTTIMDEPHGYGRIIDH